MRRCQQADYLMYLWDEAVGELDRAQEVAARTGTHHLSLMLFLKSLNVPSPLSLSIMTTT